LHQGTLGNHFDLLAQFHGLFRQFKIKRSCLIRHNTYVFHDYRLVTDIRTLHRVFTGRYIQNKELTKIVLFTPASVEEEVVPSTKELVNTQVLVTEEKEIKTPIEAEYKMMKKRKKIAATHVGWKRILCQTNMNKNVISKIQTALNEKGYKAGEADGILGRGTSNALSKFQKDNSLATGGITYETLGSLNITL